MMAEKQKRIDISLEGVGDTAPRRAPAGGPARSRSRIDLPVRGVEVAARGGMGTSLGASTVNDAELEIVNRHHQQVKELHRRARGE